MTSRFMLNRNNQIIRSRFLCFYSNAQKHECRKFWGNKKCSGHMMLQTCVLTALSSFPKLSQVFLQLNRNTKKCFLSFFSPKKIMNDTTTTTFLFFMHLQQYDFSPISVHIFFGQFPKTCLYVCIVMVFFMKVCYNRKGI